MLITRLKFPPLIVTLGTLSLFRGIAEGVTGGIQHYSGFPERIPDARSGLRWRSRADAAVHLRRGGGGRRMVAAPHERRVVRSTPSAILPEGARYAGIPVTRRLSAVYIVSGLAASLAAVIYVAHLGQAKSDAGTGYELMAITAVVLGGASIFGGRGTILGTVLGLFSIVLLQNGLRLTGQPAELSGILTGVLLVATIMVDLLSRQSKARPTQSSHSTIVTEQDEVRNSQVAVLSGVILAGALIVAASNWMLVNSLRGDLMEGREVTFTLPNSGSAANGRAVSGARRPVVALMPKAKGDPYFISARKGADSAAKALGVELLWDGPTDLDPAKQNEVVEAWITRGVNAIAVSVENKEAISTVLRKARARGIKVVTWDADAEKDARDFFVNQATPQGIGYTLTDEAARIMGGKGEFAIITASLSAANQNEWIKYIRRAAGREVSRDQARGDPAERGRSRPRLLRDADRAQGASEREGRHGDRGAGRAGRGGGGEAVGPHRREGDRAIAAEHVPSVREIRSHRELRALEHGGPRRARGAHGGGAHDGRAEGRRHVARRGGDGQVRGRG